MSRKPAAVAPETFPAPELAPAPLPQGGGAFALIDGALVEDQDAAPPTTMPGATRAETTR